MIGYFNKKFKFKIMNYFLAALFPTDSTDAQYRTDLKNATIFLRRNHSEHYKVL